MWSYTTVAHLLQGSMCPEILVCVAAVIKSCYFNVCCLSIGLNPSGHSPPATFMNKEFPSIGVPLTGIFFCSFPKSYEMSEHLYIL